MKPNLKLLIAALCGIFVTTAVFGQNTYIWTNNSPGDISTAANWTPNGVPSSNTGDILEFNGQSSGPVVATANTSAQQSSGTPGLNFWVTGNQTNSVTLCTTVANALAPYVRCNDIQIDSGAGTFNLGNASTTNAIQYEVGNANPQTHLFVNNSTNTAIIWPNVAVRAGGGGGHTFDFSGTGTWSVTNDLNMDNGSSSKVQVDGPGTLVWTAGHNSYSIGNSSIPGSPLVINGGSLILKSPGLFASTVSSAINNYGTLLEWDLGTQSQTYAGTISGTGMLQVNSGTLTLGAGSTGGQNIYTGNTVLSGGELIVNSAENLGASGPIGVGGTITFSGGTLGFSTANTYDYSPRFDTTANQSYSLDTAGQNVMLANALTSSGGTLAKLGSGTLTLAGANTYSDLTTVSAGKLVIQGSQGNGAITVANSAALGVKQGGAQITPATLTVGTTSGATLEFNNVTSTTTAAINAGTLAAGGTITVNINSGSFVIGTPYPLLHWTSGTFTVSSFALGSVTGAGGNLTVSGNTLYLNVTALASTWTGNADAIWSATSGALDWKAGGSPSQWIDGAPALFDDTVANANTNITLSSPVIPSGVTVNNNTAPYTITSSGANLIAGSGGLTKNGNSTLTLSGGINTYSGGTTISGGTLTVGALANGGSASDIGASSSSGANLVLNGGTLQYTGSGATSDHLFTLGTAGGTIDNEGTQLTLNNSGAVALSGTGARTLTLTGSDASGDTLAAVLGDNGGATALTKSGAGTWILTGNSTNSGTVTINAGTLQVGTGGSGSIGSGNVVDQGVLDFNIAGTVTNGIIIGSGSVIVDGSSKVILPGNNSYSGGTTINLSATLQVGNGGATGSLNGGTAIEDDGLLIFNTTGSFVYTAPINGAGNVIVRGLGGQITANGANTYSGWTEIDPGATFEPIFGLGGQLLSSLVTNNGTLLCPIQDNGSTHTIIAPMVGSGKLVTDAATAGALGTLHLTGDSTYTGGTIIQQCEVIVGDGNVSGSIVGNVLFTNSAYGYEALPRSLHFNRADDVTFSGNITGLGGTLNGGSVANAGQVVQDGTGTLTLTGTNTYLGGTVINAGAVQVGNGGTSGSISSGGITDNGALIYNHSDNLTVSNTLSGTGTFMQFGSGSLTLIGNGSGFTGALSVSNGTVWLNSTNDAGSGEVHPGAKLGGTGVIVESSFLQTDAGSTLTAGASGSSIGTLTIPDVTLVYGNVFIKLDKSQAQSNDVVATVGGPVYNYGTGNTFTVTNLGPALKAGDKFTIFSQPSSSFASVTVTGAGATWQNNLDVDGSITALTVPVVNTNPPVLQMSVTGSTLNLAWPTNRYWTLLTNSVGVNAPNSWFPYPRSFTFTNVSIPINKAGPNVFFRMVYTNTP